MWQFKEAVHGLADACKELGIPVSGGNVSFYNQTGETPILPTPVVGVAGVMDNVEDRIGHRVGAGQDLLLIGETRDELGGSIWQQVVHDSLAGLPPQVDMKQTAALVDVFCGATDIAAAHDLSEGGLAQGLAELAIYAERGFDVSLADVHDDAFVALFSESAGRVLVACEPENTDGVIARAGEAGLRCVRIGKVNDSDGADAVLRVTCEATDPGAESEPREQTLSLAVAELKATWEATLPHLFGHAAGANSVIE